MAFTAQDVKKLREMTNCGINFITTDNPVDALKVEQIYNLQKAGE